MPIPPRKSSFTSASCVTFSALYAGHGGSPSCTRKFRHFAWASKVGLGTSGRVFPFVAPYVAL